MVNDADNSQDISPLTPTGTSGGGGNLTPKRLEMQLVSNNLSQRYLHLEIPSSKPLLGLTISAMFPRDGNR